MILDELEDLRRNAYVRAVMSDRVVGYVGPEVPVEVFHAMELDAFPVYGIDAEILEYSCEENLCPLVDATITYAKTDKCPLIHSSKLIVVDGACEAMFEALYGLAGKRIYRYDGNIEALIDTLSEVYDAEFRAEELQAVREELKRIHRRVKELTSNELQGFVLEYYMNFLDLAERMSYLDGLQEVQISHAFIERIYRCSECRGKL